MVGSWLKLQNKARFGAGNLGLSQGIGLVLPEAGEGSDFRNAEGAKVTQRAQKGREKVPKIKSKIKPKKELNFYVKFEF